MHGKSKEQHALILLNVVLFLSDDIEPIGYIWDGQETLITLFTNLLVLFKATLV